MSSMKTSSSAASATAHSPRHFVVVPSKREFGCCRNGLRDTSEVLHHDPEKWVPVFRKRSCSNKRIEDGVSKKRYPALAAGSQPVYNATLRLSRISSGFCSGVNAMSE